MSTVCTEKGVPKDKGMPPCETDAGAMLLCLWSLCFLFVVVRFSLLRLGFLLPPVAKKERAATQEPTNFSSLIPRFGTV